MLPKRLREEVAYAVKGAVDVPDHRGTGLKLRYMKRGYWAIYGPDMGGGFFRVASVPERPTIAEAYITIERMLLKHPTYFSVGQIRAVMAVLKVIVIKTNPQEPKSDS